MRLTDWLQAELSPRARFAVLGAGLLLAGTVLFPLWQMTMFATMFPEGLRLSIYSWKIVGGNGGADLQGINILNHYIGMREIRAADFVEMRFIPFMFGAFVLLGARAGNPAVGEHERRLGGVGRRRNPGIQPRLGTLGQGAQPECGPQPVGGAVAHHDGQHEHAEQKQRPQREGIVAVGARRRSADPQAAEHLGETLAMHPPQRGGAGIGGAEGEGVLVGGGRAVAHAGDALHPPDGLLAAGPAHHEEGDHRSGEGEAEKPQDDLVRQFRQPRP